MYFKKKNGPEFAILVPERTITAAMALSKTNIAISGPFFFVKNTLVNPILQKLLITP